MGRTSRRLPSVRVILVGLCVALLVPSVALADWPAGVMHHSIPATRIAGANRFANSVAAAKAAYPAWAGVDHVVIASGMNDALYDPLMASSLCWAYNAPMLLVTRTQVPAEVTQALKELASVNPTFTVTVVDSTATVPPAVLAGIRASAGATATIEQPWPRANRYSLGRAIAERVRGEAAASARTIPSVAFVVNGVTTAGMLEGAPAAAIAARTGIPVLLTAVGSAPAATILAVNESGAAERIVVGSTTAVSAAAATQVGATTRWTSASLAANSAAIATRALGRGWTHSDAPVFYGNLPDALVGAQIAGRGNGISVYASGARLEKPTAVLLSKVTTTPAGAWAVAGTSSMPGSLFNEVRGAPSLPYVTSLRRYEGAKARVAGKVGSNTTGVRLFVNSKLIASRSASPFGTYDFGLVAVPAGRSTWKVVSVNPDGKSAAISRVVDRLKFPYATCIIVDKSEFKLYWVRNNVIVKTYPVAIGRPTMETPTRLWRVGRKVQCDPRGIYGPRKMQLWKWTGSTWEFTNYAIHGTNEPWVIGTKASHGCIRMYNRDILELWPQVPLYTRVITRE